MSDAEQKISHLEHIIEKMLLDAHASRIAIAVLSTAVSSLAGKDTKLGDLYLESVAQGDKIEFDHPVPDGYRAKLDEKIVALLGTQK